MWSRRSIVSPSQLAAPDPILVVFLFHMVASFLIGNVGTTTLHIELEELVARFIRKPAALVFGMGYGTNSTVLPAILQKVISSTYLSHRRWLTCTFREILLLVIVSIMLRLLSECVSHRQRLRCFLMGITNSSSVSCGRRLYRDSRVHTDHGTRSWL